MREPLYYQTVPLSAEDFNTIRREALQHPIKVRLLTERVRPGDTLVVTWDNGVMYIQRNRQSAPLRFIEGQYSVHGLIGAIKKAGER